jgi:hypothetical protein
MPLEPYKARYTELLHGWEEHIFKTAFPTQYEKIIPFEQKAADINIGSVVDSRLRSKWSLGQNSVLLDRLDDLKGADLYYSDFFAPGIDAMMYSSGMCNTALKPFKAYSFLWAQTFDIFDFTVKQINWMRPWEIAAFEFYDGIFVACPDIKDRILSALGPAVDSKVHVLGLPFDSKAVKAVLQPENLSVDTYDCAYTSRWDTEKNPGIFLELVEANKSLQFVICTGHNELRGTAVGDIKRAIAYSKKRGSNLTIRVGLSKADYYGILARTRVQFNCALQDWVSFTLLEALCFGCEPLYPNFRSFPEALLYSEPNLYTPGSVSSASNKLADLLRNRTASFIERKEILDYHDLTIQRIAKHMYDH